MVVCDTAGHGAGGVDEQVAQVDGTPGHCDLSDKGAGAHIGVANNLRIDQTDVLQRGANVGDFNKTGLIVSSASAGNAEVGNGVPESFKSAAKTG